jgi:hypothetical protein
MKAISIRQPWATLIARGVKTVEVRGRRTLHRGPLLIIASRSRQISPNGSDAIRRLNLDLSQFRRGVALCVVDLLDCRPMVPHDAAAACCPFEAGMFAWIMSGARPVEPIPVAGRLGVFTVDNLAIEAGRIFGPERGPG